MITQYILNRLNRLATVRNDAIIIMLIFLCLTQLLQALAGETITFLFSSELEICPACTLGF